MKNARIGKVLYMLNFTDVVSNVQVIDQRPMTNEKMLISRGSNFQYFCDSGESLGLSGIIFSVFGAQLRKSKYFNVYFLKWCEALSLRAEIPRIDVQREKVP